MYWTRRVGGGHTAIVSKGGMDGFNPTDLLGGSGEVDGIVIDLIGRRLYWSDRTNRRIQSSNLNGGDVMTIHQLQASPYGISLLGQRLYWGHRDFNTVQSSSTQAGSDVRVEVVGKSVARHFTAAVWHSPRHRPNDCKGVSCPGLCVLTPTSYKCLQFK